MSATDYTAAHGFSQLLRYQNNYPALGTGVLLLVEQSHNLLGPVVPDALLQYQSAYQINLFGDYPDSQDDVPSAIFAAIFAILMFLHLLIFMINISRKHRFWLSLGWVFYCLMRVIGFILRIIWGKDLSKTKIGITDEVFLILPSILLTSLNLILAQRIFTWRHPVGGSRRLFWNFMITLYVVVLGVIALTIACAASPYVHFLSQKNYLRYQKAVQASAVLIVLYSLTAISLLALAYFFKPTRKDENLYTYQPWWIESFKTFYFVKKNAVREAEETFMKRNHNHRHAIRVIAATHHHYNTVEGLTNERGDLTHNTSLWIICITTLLIFVGSICRCITVFQGRYQKNSSKLCAPVAMYICWGLFETVINLLYIIGRVDLRFYRPDRLPKKVRSIITAEQSLEHSDEEYEYYTTETETEGEYDLEDDDFGFYQPRNTYNNRDSEPRRDPNRDKFILEAKEEDESDSEEFHF
ncbi:hypothetical protein HYPBUDRAFT_171737 [Hyphopichia burtonii NRRL Y-1933]|uniref:Uncharacterized protein n=1 Tax=Hyphopichia burtonii NRRL Y-1933 TaxID=984485 RepID=A0A1E4RQJ6_9ASCO|nr:hypothetical protein HYPBUDRAFT_171737 [Hyphopichia burtonii NRRL Y-1933]ODV69550.1 hypothetical protein HYPBUDRAFT_171737 [Hyphopichia burtonii NRRL Y-1933]